MSTDVKLDQRNGECVIIEASVLQTTAADFILDAPSRRKSNTRGLRRALVHDQRDGLTINYNRDYPGGVTINDVVELSNRISGLYIRDVAEIGPYMERAGVGSGASGGRLLLRGEIMIEPVHVATASERSSSHARAEGGADTTAVSLQRLLRDLEGRVAELTERLKEFETKLVR